MQTEINYKQLGKRIQEKRKDMGIMQKDMAVAIGTAFNHLSDVERGTKKPSLELLMRISAYLDTPVDYFLMQKSALKDWSWSTKNWQISWRMRLTLWSREYTLWRYSSNAGVN